MDIVKVIKSRRAYRSLAPVSITQSLLNDLSESAQLAPSCFNNQPWRYIFVYDPKILHKMHTVFSPGNEWARRASLIVVVFSKKDFDCLIGEREYYLFDVGLATGFFILRATALGLVAHPIAGYSPGKVRKILHIPDEMNVISLVIVGKHADSLSPVLSDKQREWEKKRPMRIPLRSFVYHNMYMSDD
jgi:nitroreductase